MNEYKEFLKREGVYEKYLINLDGKPFPKEYTTSASETFYWPESKEGWKLWAGIHSKWLEEDNSKLSELNTKINRVRKKLNKRINELEKKVNDFEGVEIVKKVEEDQTDNENRFEKIFDRLEDLEKSRTMQGICGEFISPPRL